MSLASVYAKISVYHRRLAEMRNGNDGIVKTSTNTKRVCRVAGCYAKTSKTYTDNLCLKHFAQLAASPSPPLPSPPSPPAIDQFSAQNISTIRRTSEQIGEEISDVGEMFRARPASRKEAQALGLKTYMGSPCMNGHPGKRKVTSNECVDCRREGAARRAYTKRAVSSGSVSSGLRTQARELGLTRYSTGEACINGHVAERYVSDKSCVECVRLKKLTPAARARRNAKARERIATDPEYRNHVNAQKRNSRLSQQSMPRMTTEQRERKNQRKRDKQREERAALRQLKAQEQLKKDMAAFMQEVLQSGILTDPAFQAFSAGQPEEQERRKINE